MTEGEGRLVAGRYRLRGSLGSGGMGVVWRARDEYLQRDVAIKEVHLRGASAHESDPAVRRALREARAAAALRHPGIVTVHDVVTDDGKPWIVMELIEGRSLAEVLRDDGPVPEHRAARIGIQMLAALDAAHQRGILHRDVKPGNIMLDGDRVVLTDFSIAAIDGATALTGTGQLIGSPEYIAPERIDGQEATQAADLWAVGVTLYSTIVGHSPFLRTDTPATLAAIVARDPEPHPLIGGLWPVIEGLLRKSPADRLTAKAATALLTEAVTPAIVSTPPAAASAPASSPGLPETRIENPGAQVTAASDTMPNTRIAPPALPPPETKTTPAVAPAETTAVPITLKARPARGRLIALAAGVVAVIAAVTAIVWSTSRSTPPTDRSAGTPPSSPQTTTTTPPPKLKAYQESLGFSISVPEEWIRNASAESTLSDVVWQGQQRDPKIGGLKVQVQRDDTKPGFPTFAYLLERERIESTDRNNAGYRRIKLDSVPGADAAAELEYTLVDQVRGVRFHYQTRAFPTPKSIYLITFSMYATDAGTLGAQWEAAQPTLTMIRDSFRVT